VKEVAKIIIYLLGVVVLGALLTPLVFWTLRAVEPWALANGLMKWDPHESDVLVRGPLGFVTTDVQQCFNRALLIAAMLLFVPATWALEISGTKGLRLHHDPRRWDHLLRGIAIGAIPLIFLGAGYVLANAYRPRTSVPIEQLPKIFTVALFTAVVEEFIFRGAFLGIFFRAMRQYLALFLATLLFATFHFLQPSQSVVISHVNWSTGFQLLPHVFYQFTDPMLLLTAFLPLLVFGWLLSYARFRTESLWMSVGLNFGVAFIVAVHSAFTVQIAAKLPWVGNNLRTGLIGTLALTVILGVAWWRLDHEDLLPHSKSRD